jgi:hypothetical protein
LAGELAFEFTALWDPFTIGRFCSSCRRSSSGDGMPGVGVAPGLIGLFISAGSGMPGVGVVPRVTIFAAFAAGIPGVGVPFSGRGLVEIPGGRFAGSTLTITAPFVFTTVRFAAGSSDEQAKTKANNESKTKRANILSIFIL